MTPPQNVLLAKALTDAAIDVSLESLPQFQSKLDALDEPFIRNLYYLIFQQKSGSTDVVQLKKLISSFRGFTCDTEILKQKIFTNPGVWSKEKLLGKTITFAIIIMLIFYYQHCALCCHWKEVILVEI